MDKLGHLINSLELSADQRRRLEEAIAERDSTLDAARRSVLAEDEATVNLVVGDSDVVPLLEDPNQDGPQLSEARVSAKTRAPEALVREIRGS